MTNSEDSENIHLTPFKLQQIGLAHQRLMNNYLEQVLGDALETLWAISIGIFKQDFVEAQWMKKAIASVQASEKAQAVRNLSHVLNEALKDGMPPDEAFCGALIHEDLALMQRLKLALRDGLLAFEQFQTIQQASYDVMDALERIPAIMENYYQHFDLSLFSSR